LKLPKSEVLGVRHIRALGFETLSGDLLSGVSTDSRTTKGGDIFIAIHGEKFDGHDFITKAIGGGAAVVIVDRKWADANGTMLVSISVPRLVVEDTTIALGELAAGYRAHFKIPFIAIAGSNGKTTTKNMVSAVLGTKYNVLSTEGNLNNQIGVPQTLFRLTSEHDLAVVEIGTNHFGEIASLCRILAPTHGVITNIGREHLEFFGSLDGVAKAEGELVDWLRATKGTFFLNKDDEHLARRIKRSKGLNVSSFGLQSRGVDVKGNLLGSDETGCTRMSIRPKGKKPFECQLNIPGEQNARNALAASAVGLAMKISPRNVTKALTSFTPAGKRSEIIRLNGLTILNDSYNANPDSVIAALKTLRSMKTTGRRIAVLGDMLELGKSAEKEHRRIGKALAQCRVDCLFTFGTLSKITNESARVRVKTHFEDKTMLAEQLAEFVSANDAVLVKGSRGMKMEEVVAHLQHTLKK
jgi:UDP-N-acetylmuramoyl-tripeptide--D-alanyl-D-alanine ligase